MSITYCECVFVALGIHHAMRMCHIVICGLSGYTKVVPITHTILEKKYIVIEHKTYVFIFSTTFV
jgi:hypothetical protein